MPLSSTHRSGPLVDLAELPHLWWPRVPAFNDILHQAEEPGSQSARQLGAKPEVCGREGCPAGLPQAVCGALISAGAVAGGLLRWLPHLQSALRVGTRAARACAETRRDHRGQRAEAHLPGTSAHPAIRHQPAPCAVHGGGFSSALRLAKSAQGGIMSPSSLGHWGVGEPGCPPVAAPWVLIRRCRHLPCGLLCCWG